MDTSQKTYLDQIDKYYNKKLKTYSVIELGMTPDILVKYGALELPMIMLQSTLTKCIRKATGSRSAHELPRSIIETLPDQIKNPIFLIQDKARKSIALISDVEDTNGHKILTAILLDAKQHANSVNEIKSVYGKTNLKEYLKKHMELNQLNIIDNKKAEMLSRVLGLQLPMALITSNFEINISLESGEVNPGFQFLGKDKMISLMKSQFEYFSDLEAGEKCFSYIRFREHAERLTYMDDYSNEHDLYHSIVGGKEVCLYYVNDERNKRIELTQPKESILYKLDSNKQIVSENISQGNNLERQRPQNER